MQTLELIRIYKISNGYIVHDPSVETDEFLDDLESVVKYVASLAGDDIDIYILLSNLAKEQKEIAYSKISLIDSEYSNKDTEGELDVEAEL